MMDHDVPQHPLVDACRAGMEAIAAEQTVAWRHKDAAERATVLVEAAALQTDDLLVY